MEKKDKKFEELWAQKRQLDEERRMLDFEMKRLQDERIERNMRRVHRQQLFREQEIKKKLEEENQRLQSLKELTRATQMEVEKQQVRMFLQKEQWRAKIRNLNHHTVMELHQSHFSEKGREEH